MTSRELDQHVAELCRRHKIRRIIKPGRGRARVSARVIRHPPITLRDPMTYFVALHEVGHCVVGLQGSRLDRETWCWLFAFRHSRLPITYDIRQRVCSLLVRYLFRAGASSWKMPDDEHPIWDLVMWWQTPAWVAAPDGLPDVPAAERRNRRKGPLTSIPGGHPRN